MLAKFGKGRIAAILILYNFITSIMNQLGFFFFSFLAQFLLVNFMKSSNMKETSHTNNPYSHQTKNGMHRKKYQLNFSAICQISYAGQLPD